MAMLTCSLQPNTAGSCQLVLLQLKCKITIELFVRRRQRMPQEMIGCILSMEYFRRWCKSHYQIMQQSLRSIPGLKSCVPSPFYLTKYLEFFSRKLLWLKVELRSECNKSNSSSPAQLIVAKYQTTLVSFVCHSSNPYEAQTMFRCYMLNASMFNVKCKDVAECARPNSNWKWLCDQETVVASWVDPRYISMSPCTMLIWLAVDVRAPGVLLWLVLQKGPSEGS